MGRLEHIAGLAGFIREWQGQPLELSAAGAAWRPLPVRNDFGLRLRLDGRLQPWRDAGLRLRARIAVVEERATMLVLNLFSGYRLFLDGCLLAAPPVKASYCFEDLRHPLHLAPGVHELVIELLPAQAPPVFAARLTPAEGIEILPAGESASATKLRRDTSWTAALDVDAEAFRYYNALAATVPQPAASWTDTQTFATWRDAFRRELRRLMPRPPGADSCPLDATTLRRDEFGDYVRETVRLAVEPGWFTEVYLFIPCGRGYGPWPALLCLHGHGYGKDDPAGIDHGDPERRAMIDALHYDYALRYVRRGYVTATFGMRLIGDRGLPRERGRRDPCDNGYFQATLFGRVPAALDVSDAQRVLTYLASRPEVARDTDDRVRLGCVGLSYGGRATMYLTALDDRVGVAVVSGAMNTFRERLTSFAGCGSQFVPGLFAIGDTAEVLASIAPRPLLLELGSRDGTSPAIFAEDIARTLTAAYAAAGTPERLMFDLFEGEHWYSGRLADAWLDRWLGTQSLEGA